MAINFDQFYFFNGVGKINQENFPEFFRWILPDGVIYDATNKMEPYADSTGMRVKVKTGICYVHCHRGAVTAEKTVTIEAADPTYPRIDLVVACAVYGVSPNSKMVIDVKKGNPSATPSAPALQKTAGVAWEIPLAEVRVNAGITTIAASAVTDKRIWSVHPLSMGGTGGKTQEEALANIIGASALSVPNGGTGSINAAGARANLEVPKMFEQSVTIAVADWNGNLEATKTVNGVLAGAASKVWDSVSWASRAQYGAADVALISNAANSVTWKCAVKPTAAITLTVIWTA